MSSHFVCTCIHIYAHVCTTQAMTLQCKLRICASVYPPSLWYFVLLLPWRLPFWLLANGAATAREQLKQKPAVSKTMLLMAQATLNLFDTSHWSPVAKPQRELQKSMAIVWQRDAKSLKAGYQSDGQMALLRFEGCLMATSFHL